MTFNGLESNINLTVIPIERISTIPDMDDLVSRQTVHDTVLSEYGNNELHHEVMPGTVLPTFSRIHWETAVTNFCNFSTKTTTPENSSRRIL